MKLFYMALASLVLVVSTAHAQRCNDSIDPSTPFSQFTVDANKGTVTDNKTGLMWKRCAEGQSGEQCLEGDVELYNWSKALILAARSRDAGYSDWRLPNIKELRSLVEEQCLVPAINAGAFPNASDDFYWSSTPYAGYVGGAWTVNFNDGASDDHLADIHNAVRLVRNAQ